MKIVVGITGGIAAYKAVSVVRALVLEGHDVQVVATDAALRFVGRPTLEAISRNAVHSELYEGVAEVRHVALGQQADLIVIAPATANTLAKLATGLADDLLGNTVLASKAPLLLAPAMHTEMWQHPSTEANVAVLATRGAHFVGPARGQLTGADSGLGRMAEPDEIVAAALRLLATQGSGELDLADRRILITAGGTREPLDPVRFVGNRSSGKQGVALARAAAARGAEVTLIVANIDDGVLAANGISGVEIVHVSTTDELKNASMKAAKRADTVIMAAAVADYRPETVAESKIKKEDQGDVLELRLIRNPDILKDLTASRRKDQLIVGFAAETEVDRHAMLGLARAKTERKGVDYLVVNRVGWTEGFATDENVVVMLNGSGDIVAEAEGSKASVADRILDVIR